MASTSLCSLFYARRFRQPPVFHHLPRKNGFPLHQSVLIFGIRLRTFPSLLFLTGKLTTNKTYHDMIPAITPPTDNLYKFIALFGLTIFLFAVYNMSLVYDNYSLDRAKVEELKTSIRKKNIQAPNDRKHSEILAGRKEKKERILFKNLTTELMEAEQLLGKSRLAASDSIQFKGEIIKLNVAIEGLRFKLWIYLFLSVTGAFLMGKGFLSWKKKEQDIRDSILHIEHAIKLLEQESRARKKKKKKLKAIRIAAAPVEKQPIIDHLDQN